MKGDKTKRENLILYPAGTIKKQPPCLETSSAGSCCLDYCSFIASRALASWSGHEVPLPPQSVPFKRLITSSTFMPLTRLEIPLVFPLQPLLNFTDWMVSPSTSISMEREYTPFVLYHVIKHCLPFCAYYHFTLYQTKIVKSTVGYLKTVKNGNEKRVLVRRQKSV